MKKKKTAGRAINTVISIGLASLVGVAIGEQLRRPPEQRTWHGSILGIPYDFRLPTVERLSASFWNKDTSQIFVPHAFGLGWSLNLYPLIHPKPAR